MAHLVSDEVFRPGFEGRPVKTENDKTLYDFTAEDVEFILRLLAFNNTRYSKTVAQLENDYGLSIHYSTLRRWVESYFTQRYIIIQQELSEQINKKLSGITTDLAEKAAHAEGKALERTYDELKDEDNEMSAYTLASISKILADATGKNIEQSALLSDRPTSIVKHQNPDDALDFLKKIGIIKDREPEVIDSTAEED